MNEIHHNSFLVAFIYLCNVKAFKVVAQSIGAKSPEVYDLKGVILVLEFEVYIPLAFRKHFYGQDGV